MFILQLSQVSLSLWMNEICFPELWNTYLTFAFYCIEYISANQLKSILRLQGRVCMYKKKNQTDKLIDFSFCG